MKLTKKKLKHNLAMSRSFRPIPKRKTNRFESIIEKEPQHPKINLTEEETVEYFHEYSIEQDLLGRSLHRAVQDLDITSSEAKEAAIKWFLSDNTREWSFVWICDCLNLNPQYFLKQLKKHKLI